MESWKRGNWNSLTKEERRKQVNGLLEMLPAGFEWLRTETFERFGQTRDVEVFACKGREFVFVPGDTAIAGWTGIDKRSAGETPVRQRLLALFEKQFQGTSEEASAYLSKLMSPVREVTIRPLLVERQTTSAGWYPFSIDELDPEEDADVLEEIERFRGMPQHSLEIYQYLRLERHGEDVRLYLFDDSETFEEWSEVEIEAGFALPTEDEWEVLYGAGASTLFPWGDGIDESMRLKHFARGPHELELPNSLGLCFPGDPYVKELVLTPGGYTGKGGDGGNNIHGGLGPLLGYLPTATAFRDPHEQELDWPDLLDCLVYRRIVRL
ncbi:hypothetical protein [Saccharibacillus endophyticus]|uniref:Sulfatase-modifying factor enzyme domain-containing protein n=1 Tax=Saccharibacillus endophyticus TaxID=2060666 RepID=A0ABQ1ZYW8_9BACL|nr:hypothetical protein [Saccharibacillus endophyticus]GGH80384.1 hypothetical protein GCM10007362_28610 [Saccharibacillus endophyticus]